VLIGGEKMVKVINKSQFEKIEVIKRDGKKVPFNNEKIMLAISKGFNNTENIKYHDDDKIKVLEAVLENIEDSTKEINCIKIDDIQNLIEDKLKEFNYFDVLENVSNYRKKRLISRNNFIKREHGLIKSLESLTLKDAKEEDIKRDNANIDGNSAMGTMLQYGSTLSKEFSKSYLMNPKFAELHDSGQIHIHDMDFLPMGTTTCCQIDLLELFKNGFSTGHGYLREPNDIMSYSALAAIAIQANQNDQHGGQSLPAFDFFLAPGVIKTFKKQFKQTLFDFLELEELTEIFNKEELLSVIDNLNSIDIEISIFDKFYKESNKLQRIFDLAYQKAIKKTDRITYQAMEAFIHNLNTMHSRAGAQVPFSSVNFGTDTSSEGRMVIKNYLLALDSGLGHKETPIFPISIFKVKEGINYFKEDPNYDLFELSCKVSSKRLFPNFSFLDSPFNLKYYKKGDYKTEVAYMGCRTRVMGNVNKDKEITPGRGNLSFTSINLPRIGIKHGIATNKKCDMDGFYQELSNMMDLVKEQLLERFDIQCHKKVYNFPFLLGQGIWMDSSSLKPNSRLKRVLKNGTLAIGFIGLAETLKALIGKHHGESEKARKLGYEIIKFMRDKVDEYTNEYNLNFSLLATPAESLSGKFVKLDKEIYGTIEGVTDRKYYTNSFHVPVYYNISIIDKLKIEGPYHELTNGGHISYIELDGDTTNNIEAFMKIIRIMHDNNIGYGAINHPVDRDPVCGYTGVINDVCPCCGRRENEGIKMERLNNIER